MNVASIKIPISTGYQFIGFCSLMGFRFSAILDEAAMLCLLQNIYLLSFIVTECDYCVFVLVCVTTIQRRLYKSSR